MDPYIPILYPLWTIFKNEPLSYATIACRFLW
jgi:hypothetical protein